MAIYSKVSGIGASVIKSVDGISISKIRSVNASLSSAFALLLDERYGFGAEAAYSVRRLSGVYNGPLLVVRRDSDDATLEIGFTSSNDLDVSAIETFCGTANGYVLEWRDQSGNLNHARQSAETSQPKIYDATTGVVIKNGRPALTLATNYTRLDLNSTVVLDGEFSHFTLCTTFCTDNPWGGDSSGTEQTTWIYFSNCETGWRLINQGGITNYAVPKTPSGTRLLQNHNRNSSNATSLYLDGYLTSSPTATGNYYVKAVMGSPWFDYKGFGQEMIFYNKDQTGNRTDIESNIGDYYGDNVELLDTYTGAEAAYSLRKLSSSYNGALVRVREDGTDTQADIYANVFGELDTVALANHCGSNNGLVVGWYDQSGNLNNATQPSLTAQPKIYDSVTGVVTENRRVAVSFDGSSNFLESGSLTTASQPISVITTTTPQATAFSGGIINTTDTNNFIDFYRNDGGFAINAGTTLTSAASVNYVQGNQYVRFSLFNGASSEIFVNGVSVISGNANTTGLSGNLFIGKFLTSANNFMNGFIQEAIIYPSDESANRTGIEDNINTFYGIYDTGLIGEYSGAAAAYSLRSLSSVYDGAAITVRRDSDDSTKNIYFDSDGNLDTAALTGFCGNNNGYIARWFDQSGNSNNVTQASLTAQPKIYDSTTGVVTENGKPAVEFDGTNDSLGASSAVVTGAEFFCSVVLTMGTQGSPWADQGTLGIRPYQASATNLRVQYNTDNGSFQMTGDNSGSGQRLKTTRLISGTQEIYDNGLLATSATNTFTSLASNDALIFGRRYNSGSSTFFNGKSQEFVFYTSDQSANRTGIEANINNNYLIYQPDTAPTSGLLASYPGAAAAYSLRQLSNEAVIAVTVRRDSDDNVSPIGFDGRELDTEALAAWCGNSNGYVTTWWDQSTLGNHATQASLTAQPKIYDSTTGVVTENGKPAVQFDGSSDYIEFGELWGSDMSMFATWKAAATGEQQIYNMEDSGVRFSMSTHRNGNSITTRDNSGAGVSALSGNPTITALGITSHITNSTSTSHSLHHNNVSLTGTQASRAQNGTNTFGSAAAGSAFYLNGVMSEAILYLSDKTTDRTNIENDIFSFYTSYLLDQYSGAAAAYSLRALSSTATNAVQVRRDSDDATQYIGFVRDGFSLSLDTSALSTFCGSANGYVSEWVDQSGNGNHATQPSDTAQPKIYDATTGVVTENGKPAIYFEGSFISAPSVSMSSATCFVHHTNFDANARMAAAFDRYDNSFFYDQVTGYWVRNGGSIQITGLPSTTSKLVYASLDSAGGELGINGATATTGTLYVKGGTMDLDIGKRLSSYWKGTFSEVVVYDSDQSSNRTNIEDNINGYYDIY